MMSIKLIDKKNYKFLAAVVIIILLLLSAFGFILIKKYQAKNYNAELTIQALNGGLTKSIDKTGAEISKKNLIMLDYKTLKNLHVSDSSEIGRLKKIITKNTISASKVSTATSGTLTSKTPTITFNQVNNTSVCDSIYPEYAALIEDKWSTVSVVANKDSVTAIYNIVNELEFAQQNEKQGKWPFRKTVPMVTAKNLNPHTKTTAISSYAVALPNNTKKITTLGTITLIIGFVLGVFIAK